MSGSTSYVMRKLDFRFTLQSGKFSGTDSDTLTVTGLRARADLALIQRPSSYQMTGRIFGLPQSVMNDLSTMGKLIGDNKFNHVAIYAGDDTSGMSLVFNGSMHDAWGNYHSAPEVSFDISATTGAVDAISATSPLSYNGGVDVASMLSDIASKMTPKRTFENHGVNVILHNAYHSGTRLQQIQEICEIANINYSDDGEILAIWPQGGSRSGEIPLISPTTGMVGYPTYTSQGIDIVTIYNPSIRPGGLAKVESSIKGANKTFIVGTMVHNLEAQTSGGAWFTAIRLIDPAISLPGQAGGNYK